MRYSSSGRLTLFFEGRIDAVKAAKAANDIKAICGSYPSLPLFVDMEGLEHICTEGISLLTMLRDIKGDPDIVNVTDEIWPVLEAEGITDSFSVSKAPRRIVTEGMTVISRDGGTMYRSDSGTLIKVYPADMPRTAVERAKRRAEAAIAAGVPAAVPEEIVRTDDGYGIVLRCGDARLLSDVINKAALFQWNDIIKKYSDFVRSFHEICSDSPDIPDAKDMLRRSADMLADAAEEDDIAVLHELIECMPDSNTLLQGCPHPNAIMVSDGELMFTDVTGIAKGSSILDLASLFGALIDSPQHDPETAVRVGMDPQKALSTGHSFFAMYNGITEPRALGGKLADMALVWTFLECTGAADGVICEESEERLKYTVETVLRRMVIPKRSIIKMIIR